MAAIFPDDIFKRIFLNENGPVSIKYFTEFCSLEFNWLWFSVGSDNGLAPSNCLVIVIQMGTNDESESKCKLY